ncbi:glutathione S-transferase family protein [Tistrella bauzanensis]|uniref:Glutathione S-transferase family protein n=1 Tax=Tistrella arctica TaxID=3133430 RepID=A0ABU9YDZ4_9PROT
MTQIILHHYDNSPFAEKARLMMGFKGLTWQSVIQPVWAPKPQLTPLTGGYRRTPVMQIGADIYIDTNLIAEELERRHPSPTLFPENGTASGGWGGLVAYALWAERMLFWPAVRYAMAWNAEKMPQELIDDRARMNGAPRGDVAKMKAAIPLFKEQLHNALAVLDDALGQGSLYLFGDEPSLADFAAYHPIWFLENNGRKVGGVMAEYLNAQAWTGRVREFRHGTREDMMAEQALAIAREASPIAADPMGEPDENAPAPGTRVTVTPDDFGRDPVEGEVMAASRRRISIRREDPEVGEVAVHFPRIGYVVRPV